MLLLNNHLFGKQVFIRFTVRVFRKRFSIHCRSKGEGLDPVKHVQPLPQWSMNDHSGGGSGGGWWCFCCGSSVLQVAMTLCIWSPAIWFPEKQPVNTLSLALFCYLTLKAPNKNCSRRHFIFLFLSFDLSLNIKMKIYMKFICCRRDWRFKG